jgi:hypothetical protein
MCWNSTWHWMRLNRRAVSLPAKPCSWVKGDLRVLGKLGGLACRQHNKQVTVIFLVQTNVSPPFVHSWTYSWTAGRPPSTTLISSSVSPYNSYTRRPAPHRGVDLLVQLLDALLQGKTRILLARLGLLPFLLQLQHLFRQPDFRKRQACNSFHKPGLVRNLV